jgi:hypothetical protein
MHSLVRAVLGSILGGLIACGCVALLASFGGLNKIDGGPAMLVAYEVVMAGIGVGAGTGGIAGALLSRRS